jgi:hypothetical protein
MAMIVNKRTGRLMLALPLLCAAPGTRAEPLGPKPTLHTPDVIAPAVLPYLACLYAERGLPLLRAADGAQVAYDKSSKDCSAARAQAVAGASKLLQGKAVPDGLSPGVFIEQTLTDMDGYVASLPISQGTASQPQTGLIGIPVTIEDEVKPAYDRYDECLKTQVSNSLVTAARVLDLFKLAMTTCASIRQLAVSEATKALVAKGWDEPARVRAAESTFAKVDESWLVMGHQYQQLLMERVAAEQAKAAEKTKAAPPPKR